MSHVTPRRMSWAYSEDRGIATFWIQCLKEWQRNCVRDCGGTACENSAGADAVTRAGIVVVRAPSWIDNARDLNVAHNGFETYARG